MRIVRSTMSKAFATGILMMMLTSTFVLVTPASVEAAEPAWEQETALPGNRSMAFVTANETGMVFMFGGWDEYASNHVNETCWMYNPYNETWVRIADMPHPGRGMTGALGDDGRIYIFGGRTGLGSPPPVEYTQIYNPANNTWSEGSDMVMPRYEARATCYGDFIYIAGGADDTNTITKTIQMYDYVNDQWFTVPTELPEARRGGAFLCSNSEFYYIGGTSDTEAADKATVYRYSGGTWYLDSTMPVGSTSFAGVVGPDGLFYLIGGNSVKFDLAADSRCYVYNQFDRVWTSLPNKPTAVAYSGAAALPDGRIIAVGGSDLWNPLTCVESIKVMSIDVSLPASIGTGQAFEATVSAEFAYAHPATIWLSTYYRQDGGNVYGMQGTDIATAGTIGIPMIMPQSAATGAYTFVLNSLVLGYGGRYSFSIDQPASDGFMVVQQASATEEIDELRDQVNDLRDQNEGLSNDLNASNIQLQQIRSSLDDKAGSVLVYVSIALGTIVVVMSVYMVMTRRKP